MSWEVWLGIAAIVIAGVALAIAARVWLRLNRRPAPVTPTPDTPALHARFAFVANPSKPEVTGLRDVVEKAFAEAGLDTPLWFETTIEDPGGGQTKQALADGADIVVAVGGDGTVRAVAEQLVNTGHPMGLVPLGTGNLLARNLDLPVGDTMAALRIVIAGSDRSMDVGWAMVTEYAQPSEGTKPGRTARGKTTSSPTDLHGGHLVDPGQLAKDTGKKHLFLVIAGLGFDAAMVADTDDALKAKVGWVAYFLGGARHLHSRRMRARITVDDHAPVEAKLRSVMIGNCGRLPGGFTLLPEAKIDDGILDVATVDTRGGLLGWAALFSEVIIQGFGVRHDLPRMGRIDHAPARRVTVRVESGEQAQVDGDVLGPAMEMQAWVDPQALVVRTA